MRGSRTTSCHDGRESDAAVAQDEATVPRPYFGEPCRMMARSQDVATQQHAEDVVAVQRAGGETYQSGIRVGNAHEIALGAGRPRGPAEEAAGHAGRRPSGTTARAGGTVP